MKSNRDKSSYLIKWVTVITIIAGLLVGLDTVRTPTVEKVTEGLYGIAEPLRHIEAISREPHSVWDKEGHGRVKDYILERLNEYVEPGFIEQRHYSGLKYDPTGYIYNITNILVTIPGESATGVLLVAHYDSRGHVRRVGEYGGSYGASDDGYGVAILLEAAKIYGGTKEQQQTTKDKTSMRNSLYLLFTDSEEVAVSGSKREIEEHPELLDNINLVLNVEARGVKGPVCMFETNKQNAKTMELYKRSTATPFSFSAGTAVYSVLPNMTDLMNLKMARDGRKIACMNFSVLQSLHYYHTPLDRYENISQSSVLHYETQIFPILNNYLYDSKYSDIRSLDSDSDAVFFMFMPNTLIIMSVKQVFYISIAAIILLFLLVVMNGIVKAKKRIEEENEQETTEGKSNQAFLIIKSMIQVHRKGISEVLIILVITVLIGYVIARAVAHFSSVAYNIVYVKSDLSGPIYVICMSATVLFTTKYIITRTKTDRFIGYGIATVACSFGIIISFVLALNPTLSGLSATFLFPSVVSELTLLTFLATIEERRKNADCNNTHNNTDVAKSEKEKPAHSHKKLPISVIAIAQLSIFANISYHFPFFHTLYYALSIGALPIFMFMMAFALLLVVPIFALLYQTY